MDRPIHGEHDLYFKIEHIFFFKLERRLCYHVEKVDGRGDTVVVEFPRNPHRDGGKQLHFRSWDGAPFQYVVKNEHREMLKVRVDVPLLKKFANPAHNYGPNLWISVEIGGKCGRTIFFFKKVVEMITEHRCLGLRRGVPFVSTSQS